MLGAKEGLLGLAFALAIGGWLPYWLGVLVLGAFGALALAWLWLLFLLPLLRGVSDLFR